ncbi:hypothetical protein NYE44_24280 [Paenibacillus sp. FSL L8-0493]
MGNPVPQVIFGISAVQVNAAEAGFTQIDVVRRILEEYLWQIIV